MVDEVAVDDVQAEEQPQSIDDFISQQYDAATPDMQEALGAESASEEDSEAVEAEDGGQEEETPEDAEAAPDEAIQPPQSMSAKDREAFHKLPPESQKWLTEREKQMTADYTRKNMELAEQKKTYDKIEQIIAPRRQALAMDGMDESTAIGQLFAYSDFATKDPVGFARYLLQQRGIPLTALTEPGQEADPNIIALQQQLASVTNVLNQQQTHAQAQERAAISSVVEDFAKDPAFSFYGDLETDMIPIVQALRSTNPGLPHRQYLEKAYRMAMAANEEVSAKVEADRKAKEEAERIKKVKEESAKAKKASGTNVRSSASLPAGASKAKSVDEFIGALFDERMSA